MLIGLILLNIFILIIILLLQYQKYKDREKEYSMDKNVVNGISTALLLLMLYINILYELIEF
jgi:hypothetical protein